MANYRHILFAADVSDECLQVGEHAVDLAQRYGAKLSLIHVVREPDEGAIRQARLGLADLARRLGMADAKQWVVQARAIAKQVHRVADEQGVDVIVVGSHGTHGLALLLGSTPNAVLHGAHCDVLAVLIRPQQKATRPPSYYQHILFAADLRDECLQVGPHAVDLARRYNAKLSLTHIVQERDVGAGLEVTPPLPTEVFVPGMKESEMVKEARLELADLARDLGVANAEQWVVRSNSVAHQLHHLADEHNVDLIVVGSHGIHGLALLLGSTSSEVLHGAHCDVLAVHVKPSKRR